MKAKRESDRLDYVSAANAAAQIHGGKLDASMLGIGNTLKHQLDLPHPSPNDLFSDLLSQLDKSQNR